MTAATEQRIATLEDQLEQLRQVCKNAADGPLVVPVSTFAPQPFAVLQEFSVVVRPEDGVFVATLFDANLGSAGDTPEEAVANLKDLIIMVFEDFESKKDHELGPMIVGQKAVLMSLMRRA
jgi:predicted RNase H-like HicB family nuclease